MKLEHGKTYITVGGRIVEIILIKNNGRDYYFATHRTSPGTSYGKNSVTYAKDRHSAWAEHVGWQYYENGSNLYQSVDIGNELEIIAEYPYKLTDPPEGYTWKGGFPKISTPQKDDYYITYETMTSAHQAVNKCYAGSGFTERNVIGAKRIILEKQEVWPKYYIHKDVPENWGVVRYDKNSAHFFKMGGGYKGGPFEWTNDHDGILSRGVWKEVSKEEMVAKFDKDPLSKDESKEVVDTPQVAPQPAPMEQYYIYTKMPVANRYFVKRNGEWFNYNSHKKEELFDASPESFWQGYIADGTIKPCTKEEALARTGIVTNPLNVTIGSPVIATNCVVTTTPALKEEKMKNSVFVNAVKSTVSGTLGAANYLYVEPTKIIGGYVKRSLRYLVLAGTVSAIVYGVNDPAALKKRVASVIPKITIEAPSAMR